LKELIKQQQHFLMMEKKAKKRPQEKGKNDKSVEVKTDNIEKDDYDALDFGGLPKNVPFKRNIGCGG
jgi:hypothetical protein